MGKKLIALVVMAAIAGMGSVGSTDTVINSFVQQFYVSEHVPFKPPTLEVLTPSPAVFLIIDRNSIDNGTQPNSFSDLDVNTQIAAPGLRSQLPYFAEHTNETIALYTGQVGDEGLFALTSIPDRWIDAGPTANGLQNFLEVNNNTIVDPGLNKATDSEPLLGNVTNVLPLQEEQLRVNNTIVDPGLNKAPDSEPLLGNVTNVLPLQDEQLKKLEGDTICAVVYAGDVSVDYETKVGNLTGATLGIVSFKVISVEELDRSNSSSTITTLPMLTITILDANEVCGGPLVLFGEETARTPSNPISEQPPIGNEVPQNTTDLVDVPQNTTQDAGPISSNSSDVSSGQPVNSDDTSRNGTPAQQPGNDTAGNGNATSSQSGSGNQTGQDSSSDGSSNPPSPPEKPARGQ